MKKLIALLLAFVMAFSLFGCSEDVNEQDVQDVIDTVDTLIDALEDEPQESQEISTTNTIDEYGWYYSAEEVAEYICTYGDLPSNFITKEEARDMGWEGGSVEVYAPGFAIGGDSFGNREGKLPEETGRLWFECDIDTNGADSRGAKRLVYSNDGLIYYTEDHYETFTLLYGEE